MLTEREKQMVTILQRLSEWSNHMLNDTPVRILGKLVEDAEELLGVLGLPLYPECLLVPTEPASASFEGTPEPSKTPPLEDH